MCIPDRPHKAHRTQSERNQGIPDSYKPYRTEPPKMHICPYFDFTAHFPRFDMPIVLDTKNDIERRKMPIECKIELYTRCVFNVPCYFVPCYSVQIRANGSGYARLRLSVSAGLARTGAAFSYEKGAARCSPAHTRPRRSALPYPILTFSGKNEPEQLCALRFMAFCVFLREF